MADTATDLGRIELTTNSAREKTATAKPVRLLQQYFYFFMSLLIAAVVAFGYTGCGKTLRLPLWLFLRRGLRVQ